MSARHETIRAVVPDACALIELAKAIGRAGDLAAALSAVADAARSLARAHRATVWLSPPDAGGEERVAVSPDSDAAGLAEMRAWLGEGWPPTQGETRQAAAAGALAAPLLGRDGSPFGAIWLSLPRGGEFAAEDAALLRELVEVAAGPLENLRALERAARAERRFDDFASAASDWMWEMGPDLRFTFFALSDARRVEIQPQSQLGKTRWEAAGADLAEPHWADHKALLEARRPFVDFRYSVRRRKAGPRFLSVSGKPIFAADGSFKGYRGVGRDITAETEADRALQEREARLRLALEANGIGAWDWRLSDNRVLLDDTAAGLLGLPSQTPFGVEEFFARVHPDDLDRLRADVESSRRTNRFAVEFRLLRQDGEVRWLSSHGRILRDERSGLRMIGVVADETAQRAAKAALEESREALHRQAEILQSIITSMGDGVVVADADATLLLVNPAAQRMLGLAENLQGRSYPVERSPCLSKDGRPLRDDERPLLRALGGDCVDDFEFVVRRPPAPDMLVTATARPIRSADGAVKGAVSVMRNVTEQRRSQAELAQAQKMEALGQLTGGVAHDFNNLLTVILGNAEMLLDALASARPELREMAEVTRRAASRGGALTERLLSFARQRNVEPEAVDVNRLLEGAIGMLRRSIGEDIAVEFAPSAEPAIAWADPAQLETALLNLAINARDAMPDGGSLKIAVRREDLKAPPPRAPADLAPGPYLRLSVSDTGCGMRPEVLARVFEPFFTTKEVGKGSGLGLPMVYGFARQAGGFVEIESRVNEGTAVHVWLPSSAPMAPPSEAKPEAGGGRSQASRGRVLAVEDDADVRELVAAMLTSLGYEVDTAEDGFSALAALERGPLPDVVLTDLVMPGGMDGAKLGRAIGGRWPGVRVLYTSGYSEEFIGRGCRAITATVIRKPYSRAQLDAVLQEALGARGGGPEDGHAQAAAG